MLIPFIAALTLTAAPQEAAPGPAVAAVEQTLDAFHAAAAAPDADAYWALMTPQARFVGTDATEHWSLEQFRAFADPYFARGRGWTYVPHDRVVTIAPIDCRCIAWFEEQLTNASYGETRGSGVLRLTADGWKIEQYVLSFSVPNDDADRVVAIVRGGDAD